MTRPSIFALPMLDRSMKASSQMRNSHGMTYEVSDGTADDFALLTCLSNFLVIFLSSTESLGTRSSQVVFSFSIGTCSREVTSSRLTFSPFRISDMFRRVQLTWSNESTADVRGV